MEKGNAATHATEVRKIIVQGTDLFSTGNNASKSSINQFNQEQLLPFVSAQIH